MTITTLTRRIVTEEVRATTLEEVQVHRCSVIYFLFLLGELVYVGQSNNVHSAITRHREKEFDQVFIRKVDQECDIDLLEQSCIVYFKPKYNKTVYSRKIPMPKAELLVNDFLGIVVEP
jgi:hypothetical protein